MNQFYAQQFTATALANGASQEKVAALLQKAAQISHRRQVVKTATADLVSYLIEKAGMTKNASSTAYTQGLLKEAFDNGATLSQAYGFASSALTATNQNLAFMAKVAEISNNPVLAEYAEGFIGSAKTAGMDQESAIRLLVEVVDNEKRAHTKQSDDGGMFKSPSPAPSAPDSDPSAGAPPGAGSPPPGGPGAGGPPPAADPSQGSDPSQGGSPEEQQLIQLLQSLPPEEQQQIIQQIMQQLSAASGGGQGGPGGPGGPAPGAGGPPPGAGGPPPGGPQGPA